jgi:hypothetical protein
MWQVEMVALLAVALPRRGSHILDKTLTFEAEARDNEGTVLRRSCCILTCPGALLSGKWNKRLFWAARYCQPPIIFHVWRFFLFSFARHYDYLIYYNLAKT